MPRGKKRPSDIYDINKVAEIFMEEAINAGLPAASRLAWLYILNLEGGSPFKVYVEGNKTRSYGPFQINDARRAGVTALGLKFPDDIVAKRDMPAEEIERRIRNQVKYVLHYDKNIRELLKKVNPQLYKLIEANDLSKLDDNAWKLIMGYYMAAWNAPAYAARVAKGDFSVLRAGTGPVYKLASPERRAEAFSNAIRMFQASTQTYLRKKMEAVKEPLLRAVAPTSTKYIVSGQRYPQTQVAQDKVKDILLLPSIQASFVLAASEPQTLKEWSTVLRTEVPEAEKLIPPEVKDASPYIGALLILGDMMKRDSSLQHVWSVLPEKRKQKLLSEIVGAAQKLRPIIGKPQELEKAKVEITAKLSNALDEDVGFFGRLTRAASAFGRILWESLGAIGKEALALAVKTGEHTVMAAPTPYAEYMRRAMSITQTNREKIVNSFRQKEKSKDLVERVAAQNLARAMEKNYAFAAMWGGFLKGLGRTIGDMFLGLGELAARVGEAVPIEAIQKPASAFLGAVIGARQSFNSVFGPQLQSEVIKLSKNPEFREQYREQAVHFFASQGLMGVLKLVGNRYEPTEEGWEHFASSVLTAKMYQMMDSEISKHFGKNPIERWLVEAQLNDYQAFMPLVAMVGSAKLLGKAAEIATKPLMDELKGSKNFVVLTTLQETGNVHAALRLSGAISTLKFGQRLPYYVTNALASVLFPGHLVEKGILKGILNFRLRNIGGLSGLMEIARTEGAEVARKHLQEVLGPAMGATKITSSLITGAAYSTGGFPDILPPEEKYGAFLANVVINALFDAPRIVEGITDICKGKKQIDPRVLAHPMVSNLIANIYSEGLVTEMMRKGVWSRVLEPHVTMLNRGITDINQLSQKISSGKGKVNIIATEALSIPVAADLRLKKVMEAWEITPEGFAPEHRRRFEEWLEIYHHYEETRANMLKRHKVKEGEVPANMTIHEFEQRVLGNWDKRMLDKGTWMKRKDAHERTAEAMLALHALTFARSFATWYALATGDQEAARGMFYNFVRLGFAAAEEAKRQVGAFPADKTTEEQLAWIRATRDRAVTLFYQALPAALDIIKSTTAHNLAAVATEAIISAASVKPVDVEVSKSRLEGAMRKVNEVARLYMPRAFEEIVRTDDVEGVVKRWEQSVEPLMRAELRKIYKDYDIYDSVKAFIQTTKPKPVKAAAEKSPWRLMLHKMKALETALKSAETKTETAQKSVSDEVSFRALKDIMPDEIVVTERASSAWEKKLFPEQSVKWAVDVGKYIPPTTTEGYVADKEVVVFAEPKTNLKWGLEMNRLAQEMGWSREQLAEVKEFLDFAAASIALAPFTDPEIVSSFLWRKDRDFPLVLKVSPDAAKEIVNAVSTDFNWAVVDAGRIGKRTADMADEVLLVLAPRDKFDDPEIMRFASMVRDIYWTQEIPREWWNYFFDALDSISLIGFPHMAHLFSYFTPALNVPELRSRLNLTEDVLEKTRQIHRNYTWDVGKHTRLQRVVAEVDGLLASLFLGEKEDLPDAFQRRFHKWHRVFEDIYGASIYARTRDNRLVRWIKSLLFSSFSHALKATSRINYSHRSLSYFTARNLLPMNTYQATQVMLERILATTSTALLGRPVRFAVGDWNIVEDNSGLTIHMPANEYNRFWVYYIAELQHTLTMFDISREAPTTGLNPAEALIRCILERNPEIGVELRNRLPSVRYGDMEVVRKAGAFVVFPFMFPHIVSGVVEEKMQYISSLLRQRAQENPQFLEEIRSRFYPDKTRDEVLTELEKDFRNFLIFVASVPIISSNTYMKTPVALSYVQPYFDNAVFYYSVGTVASRAVFHEILHILSPNADRSFWANEFAKLSREEAIELARFFLKGASLIASAEKVLPFSSPYYLLFMQLFKTLAETRKDITDFRTVTISDFDEYSAGIKGMLDEIETTLVGLITRSVPPEVATDVAQSIVGLISQHIGRVRLIFDQAREEAVGPQRMLARAEVLTEEEHQIYTGMKYAIWSKAILDVHDALMDIYYLLSTGRFIDLGALRGLPPDVAEALQRVLINAGEELANRLFATVMQDVRVYGLPMDRWHELGLLATGHDDFSAEAKTQDAIAYLGQPTEFTSHTFSDFVNILQRLAMEEPAAFFKLIEILARALPETGEFDPMRFLVNRLLPIRSGVISEEVVQALGDISSLMSEVEGKPYPEFYKNVLITLALLGKDAQIYGNPLPDVMARISQETSKYEALGTYAYLEYRGSAPEAEFALFEARREPDIPEEAVKKMIERGALVPIEPPEEIWTAHHVLQRIEEALKERGVVNWDSLAAERVVEEMLTKMEKEPAAKEAMEQLKRWRKAAGVVKLTDYVLNILTTMRAAREAPVETVETIIVSPQKLREALGQITQVVLREAEGKPVTEWVQKPVTVGNYIRSVVAKIREPEVVEGKEVVNLSYPKVLSALAIHRADIDEMTAFIMTRPEFAPMMLYSTNLFRELTKYLQVIGITHPISDTLEFLTRISSDDIFVRLLENYAQLYDEFTSGILNTLERRGVRGIWEEYGTTESEFKYTVLSLSSDALEKQAMLAASELVKKLNQFLQETHQRRYVIEDRRKLTEILGYAIFRDIITFLHSKNLFLSLQENARMTAAILSAREIIHPFINIRELKESQAISAIPSETWDYFERSLEGRKGLREMWERLSAIKSRREFYNTVRALIKEMRKTTPRAHGRAKYVLPGAVILHAVEQELRQKERLPERAPSIVEELAAPELIHPLILADIERKVSPVEARILKGFERSLGRMFAITERSLKDIDVLTTELPLAIPGEPSFAEKFIFRSFDALRKGVEIGGVVYDLLREEKIAVFHEVASRILLNPKNPKNLNEILRSTEVLRRNLKEFEGWLDGNWEEIEASIRRQLELTPIPQPERREKAPERLIPGFADRFRRERPIPAIPFTEEHIVLRPRKDIMLERLPQIKSVIISAIDAFADTLARNYESWIEDGVARPLPDILSEIAFSDLFRHIPKELQRYSPIHLLPEEAKEQIVGAMRQAALIKIMERFISKYGKVKERKVFGGGIERTATWEVPEIERPWLDIVEPKRRNVVDAMVKYMLDPNNKQVWFELSGQVRQALQGARWVEMNTQARHVVEFMDMLYRYTSMKKAPVAPFERKPFVGATATEFVEHTKGFVDELYRGGWITKRLHEAATETFKELKTEFAEGVSSEVVLSNPKFARVVNAVGSQMFYYLLRQIGEEWVVARELRGEAAKLRPLYSEYLKYRTPYTIPAAEKVDSLMARYFEIYELMPTTLKERLRREGVKVQSASKIRTALIGLIDKHLRQIIDLWEIGRNEVPVVERIIIGLDELLSYYNRRLTDLIEGKSHLAKRVGLYNYARPEEREDIADFIGRVYNILYEATRAVDVFFKVHGLSKVIEIEARKRLSPDPLMGLKELVEALDVPVTFTGEMRDKIKSGIDYVARRSLPSDRIILEVVRDFLVPPAKSGVSEPADMYYAVYGNDARAVLEGLGGEFDLSIGEKVREKLLQLSQVYDSMLKEAERGEWAEIVKSMQEKHPELKQYISATDVARARLAKAEIDALLKMLDEEAVTFPGLVHLSEDAKKQQWTKNLLETIGRAVIHARTMQKVSDTLVNFPAEVVETIRRSLNEATALQRDIRLKSGEEAVRQGSQAGFAFKQLVFGLSGAAALAAVGIHLPELVRDLFGGISAMVSHSMTTPAWLALAFGGVAKLALMLKNKYGINISRVLAGLASSLSRWVTHHKSQVDQIKEQTRNEIVGMVRETHGDVGAVIAEEVFSQIQEPSAYDIAETAKARHEQVVALRDAFIGTEPRRGLTTRQMAADIVDTTAANVVLDKASDLGRALHDLAAAAEMKLLLETAIPIFMSSPENHERVVMAAATRLALRVLGRLGPAALSKKLPELKKRPTPTTLLGASVKDPVTGQTSRAKITDDFEVTVIEGGQRVKKKISDMTILEILQHGLAGKVVDTDILRLSQLTDAKLLKQHIDMLVTQHTASVKKDLTEALSAIVAQSPQKLAAIGIISGTIRPIAKQLLRATKEGDLAAALVVFPEVQAMFLLNLRKLQRILQSPHIKDIFASLGFDTDKIVSGIENAFNTLRQSGTSTQVIDEINEVMGVWSYRWNEFVKKAMASNMSPQGVARVARDALQRLVAQIDRATRKRKGLVYTRYTELQKQFKTKKLPLILGSPFLALEADLRSSMVNAFAEPFNERIFNATLSLFPAEVGSKPEVIALNELLSAGKFTPMQMFEVLDKQIDGLLAKLAQHVKASKDELDADFNRLLYALYRNSHVDNETHVSSFEDVFKNGLAGLVYANHFRLSKIQNEGHRQIVQKLEGLAFAYLVLLDYLTRLHSMKAYLGGILAHGMPDFIMTEERYFPQWGDAFHDPNAYLRTFLEEAFGTRRIFGRTPKSLPKQPFEHPRTGRATVRDEEFRPMMRRALNSLITKEVFDKHRPLIRGMLAFAPSEVAGLLSWHLVNALVPHKLADAPSEIFPVDIAEDASKVITTALSLVGDFSSRLTQEMREVGETDPTWLQKILTSFQSTVLLANPRSPLRQVFSLPYAGARLARDFNDPMLKILPALLFPQAVKTIFLLAMGRQPKLDIIDQAILDNAPALQSRWMVTSRAKLQGAREVLREVLSDPEVEALVSTLLDPQADTEAKRRAERQLRGMFMMGGKPAWWKRVFAKIADWGFLALKVMDEAAVLASMKAATLAYLAHEKPHFDYTYQDIQAALHYAMAAAEAHHATPLEGYRPTAFRSGSVLGASLLFIPQVFSQFVVYTFAASENVRTLLGDVADVVVRKDLPLEKRVDNTATALGLIALLQLAIAALNGIFLGIAGKVLEEPTFGLYTREEETKATLDSAVAHALGLAKGATPRPVSLALAMVMNAAFRSATIRKTLPATVTERDMPPLFQLGVRILSTVVNAFTNIGNYTDIPPEHANFLQDTIDKILLTMPKKQRYGAIMDIVHAALVLGSLKVPELQNIPMGLIGSGLRAVAHHGELPYPAELSETFARMPKEVAAGAHFLMGTPSPYGWSEWMSPSPADLAFRSGQRRAEDMALLFVENTERSSVPVYVAELLRIIPTLRPGATMNAAGLLLSPNFYVNISKGHGGKMTEGISKTHPMVYHVSQLYDALQKDTESEFIDWIYNHPREFAWMTAMWGYDYIMRNWMWGPARRDWHDAYRNTDLLINALVTRGMNKAVAQYLKEIAEKSNEVNLREFYFRHKAEMQKQYEFRKRARILQRGR